MIKIPASSSIDFNQRVFASAGTEIARSTLYSDSYLQNSILPRGPWTGVTEDDLIRAFQGIENPNVVEILCLDNEHSRDLIELAKSSPLHGKSDQLHKRFFDSFASVLDVDDYDYLGAETTVDTAPTITWDNDGRRVGLHIDSFDAALVRDRHGSRKRVCLNVGPGPRFFMFHPRPIADIQRDVLGSFRRNDPDEENVSWLVWEYLSSHKDEPIVAVKLWPGEAYLAPTESAIHDGFVPTMGRNTSFSCIGHFTPTVIGGNQSDLRQHTFGVSGGQ